MYDVDILAGQTLTGAELDVVGMLALGLSIQEVAHWRDRSIHTVRRQAQQAMRKLEVRNRVALVTWWWRTKYGEG